MLRLARSWIQAVARGSGCFLARAVERLEEFGPVQQEHVGAPAARLWRQEDRVGVGLVPDEVELVRPPQGRPEGTPRATSGTPQEA